MSNISKVVLLGASIGIGNRGVSALGASLVRLTLSARPGAGISLLISKRENTNVKVIVDGKPRELAVINYRLSPKAPLGQQLWWITALSVLHRISGGARLRSTIERKNRWVSAAAHASLAGDIRGGDSFSDIYGLKRFLMGSLPSISVLLVRRSIVLLPQTYGPYNSRLARLVARFILRRASLILSRDRESIEIVRQLTGSTQKCQFCPDVAFALEAQVPTGFRVVPPIPEFSPGLTTGADSRSPVSDEVIGFNINGLMYRGGYTRANMFGLKLDYPQFALRLAERFLAEPGRRLLLVPHTFAPPDRTESDPGACQEVLDKLPPELRARAHLVTGEYDQHEIKGIIGKCNFFVGSRMHACIAALSQGIPTVGVAYSKKFRGVFDTVGAAEWVVDGRECDVEQAISATMKIYNQREALRQPLACRVREAQELLFTTFRQLMNGSSDQMRVPAQQ